MQALQYEFRLFGPWKGRTMRVNGHRFENGIFRTVVSAEAAGPLMKVLSFYQAYAKGTPLYDAAMKAEKEAENGASEVHKGSKRRASAPISSYVQPEGGGPTEVSSDGWEGAANSKGDGSGDDSNRDGHSDARVPKFEEAASLPQPAEPSSVGSDDVKAAVLKLDPSNDEHWVKTGAAKGLPRLSAVEDAYGKAGLTRQDLEAAIPGWNRDKALEAALEG